MKVELRHDSCLYGFDRNRFSGVGGWQVISGSCPELIGYHNDGVVVPILYGNILSDIAQEKGIFERYNFARNPPSPVKEVHVKGPKNPRERRSGLIGQGLRLSILT
jgi:hypothetical protein